MTKLYFLFLFCALASAEHPLTQSAHSNEATSAYKTASGSSNQGSSGYNAKVGHGHGSQGYSGSDSTAQDSRSSSSSGNGGANEPSAYSSQIAAVQRSGSYGSDSNENQASSYKSAPASSYSGPGSPSGYRSGSTGTRTYTGSVSASDHTSDYSGSASKTGSAGAEGYSQTKTSTYTGTSNKQDVSSASSERDHNGLFVNDVQTLAAEGNRRRLLSRYGSLNRGRPVVPKRYGAVSPKYLSHRPYSRSGDAAESNQASNYDSSGSNAGSVYSAELQQRDHTVHSSGNSPGYSSHDYPENRQSHEVYSGSSNQAGQSRVNSESASNDVSAQHYRGGNSDSVSEQSGNQYAAQDPENSRRFYLQNSRNPFDLPLYKNQDQFNDFNSENYYKAALGQYGK